MISKRKLANLNKQFQKSSLEEVLTFVLNTYSDRIAMASSLSLEDQLLTFFAIKINPETRIFILDTLRLNKETYDVVDKTTKKYDFNYEIYYPNKIAIKKLEKQKGKFSFYESIKNRKECCAIRKTEPLLRVLKTVDAWITGIRKEQAKSRVNMELFEYDQENNLLKINPLLHWTYDQVFTQVKKLKIPYNTLHEKGYPSIGCEPCTRAIKTGDDSRAGRWWWENDELQKECGLHVNKTEKK